MTPVIHIMIMTSVGVSGMIVWVLKMSWDFPIMSETPIYDQMIREIYAQRTKEAYAASPGMIGCGQWELVPENENFEIPISARRRRCRE